LADATEIELGAQGPHAGFDILQALPVGQLGEGQHQEALVGRRRAPTTVCSQCGEEWIDDQTARQLERLVEKARARRLQVEMADFA
jgi:hypothetical protein